MKVGGWIKREVRHIADESKVFKLIPGPEILDLPWDQTVKALVENHYNLPILNGPNAILYGDKFRNGWTDYATWSWRNLPVRVPDANVAAAS